MKSNPLQPPGKLTAIVGKRHRRAVASDEPGTTTALMFILGVETDAVASVMTRFDPDKSCRKVEP
jgi:hypothetical protein